MRNPRQGDGRGSDHGSDPVPNTIHAIDPQPKRAAGWWRKLDRDGRPVGYEAYLASPDRDSFDLFPFATWWQALVYALFLAEWHSAEFEGGPLTLTDWIDRRAAR